MSTKSFLFLFFTFVCVFANSGVGVIQAAGYTFWELPLNQGKLSYDIKPRKTDDSISVYLINSEELETFMNGGSWQYYVFYTKIKSNHAVLPPAEVNLKSMKLYLLVTNLNLVMPVMVDYTWDMAEGSPPVANIAPIIIWVVIGSLLYCTFSVIMCCCYYARRRNTRGQVVTIAHPNSVAPAPMATMPTATYIPMQSLPHLQFQPMHAPFQSMHAPFQPIHVPVFPVSDGMHVMTLGQQGAAMGYPVMYVPDEL